MTDARGCRFRCRFCHRSHTAAYSRPESRRGFRCGVSWRRARAAPLILARLRRWFRRRFRFESVLARVDEVMRRGSTSASLHYLLPLQLPYPVGGTPTLPLLASPWQPVREMEPCRLSRPTAGASSYEDSDFTARHLF